MSSIFNEKKTETEYLYLKIALIMKLFLNKTFLTDGSDRSGSAVKGLKKMASTDGVNS